MEDDTENYLVDDLWTCIFNYIPFSRRVCLAQVSNNLNNYLILKSVFLEASGIVSRNIFEIKFIRDLF